jgi:hypothetical protein
MMCDDDCEGCMECNPPFSDSWCRRCSFPGHTYVHHATQTICDRDPSYVVNVIAQHFKESNPKYVGIIWEAIANGVLTALGWSPGGPAVTINGDGTIA